MKKTILSMALVIGMITVTFGQTLKIYTIGEKVPEGQEQLETTVAGIQGIVIPVLINDGTIYSIYFSPSNDGKTVSRVYGTDVTRLVNGLEKKYGIELKPYYEEYGDDIDYYLGKDKITDIYVSVNHNQFMDKPYELTFLISSRALTKIYEKEQQNKANDDF